MIFLKRVDFVSPESTADLVNYTNQRAYADVSYLVRAVQNYTYAGLAP